MIVVDTSVWIAARRKQRVADVLRSLLEADEVALAMPVRLELLSGIAGHQRRDFLRTSATLPQLHPTEDTWRTLPAWIERAADAGQTFSIPDLLIASSTSEIGGLVWSLDKDFERMEKLGFVGRYDPPDIH
jgi:predicted nucleic acid-binding protein